MAQGNETVASQLNNTQEITADSLPEQTGAERRRYARRAARWRASITTRNKDVIECRTLDVSERGASIESPADFRHNAVVIVQVTSFSKGKKKNFKILCEVKHTSIAKNGFTLGIFFKDTSEETFNFFRQYSEGKI